MLDRHHDDGTAPKTPACIAQLQRLEWVAFSDFRLIGTFVKDCESDIVRHSCGRLNTGADTNAVRHSQQQQQQQHVLSQGETLACLQTHIDTLRPQCQLGVLHLSEYQADNVKLDRQLFVACDSDAHRFCGDLRPGTGAVYKCLLRNKSDAKMSERCGEQLRRRDKLIAHDYRVSRGLSRSCKDDIKTNRCRRGVSEDKDVRLAQILLCLETVQKNGTRLSADCVAEMDDHRRLLMEVRAYASDFTEYNLIEPVCEFLHNAPMLVESVGQHQCKIVLSDEELAKLSIANFVYLYVLHTM